MIVSGRVMGTDAIDEVTVIKNGLTFRRQRYRIASMDSETQNVEVTFYSPSHPVGMAPDNPRGYRLWHGHVDVANAKVLDVAMTWDNPHFPPTRIDAERPGRVHFATRTRGERERLQLVLEGVSAKTTVAVHLDENREQPTAPATFRSPQVVPATDLVFGFDSFTNGRSLKQLSVDEYVDEVGVNLVAKDAPRMQTFEVIDDGGGRPGDTYYVRIEQANGGLAWSSPVFVVASDKEDQSIIE